MYASHHCSERETLLSLWIDCEFSFQWYPLPPLAYHRRFPFLHAFLILLACLFPNTDLDTFHLPVLLNVGGSSQTNQTYNMTNQNIAWSSDSARFGKTTYTNDQVMPPPNWVLRYPNGTYDDAHPLPDLSTWYEFQVWMRTAGLPTFSKLALRNADEVMTAGTYQIDIDMSITSDSVGWELTVDFPVTEYGGTKTLVLSTRTVIGGQNNFLGIAYIVVAGLCILLGAIFTARHLIKPRKLGDHQYLSWNTAPTASGREMNIG